MAYEAAVDAGMEFSLVKLYEASCVRLDSSWYAERLGLSRLQQRQAEATAIDEVFSQTEELLKQMAVGPYILAPIVSEERWAKYVSGLAPYDSSDLDYEIANQDGFKSV